MTCVVGMIENGKMMLGADSAGVAGDYLEIRRDPKVYALARGRVLIGFAGSYRGGQLLAHRLSVPRMRGDGDVYRYMAVEFIDAVRQCFKDHGHTKVENGEESSSTHALIATEGRLFVVYDDLQVGEIDADYAAIGSGRGAALGAMHALADSSVGVRGRLEYALTAAERWNAWVRGPFYFVESSV